MSVSVEKNKDKYCVRHTGLNRSERKKLQRVVRISINPKEVEEAKTKLSLYSQRPNQTVRYFEQGGKSGFVFEKDFQNIKNFSVQENLKKV